MLTLNQIRCWSSSFKIMLLSRHVAQRPFTSLAIIIKWSLWESSRQQWKASWKGCCVLVASRHSYGLYFFWDITVSSVSTTVWRTMVRISSSIDLHSAFGCRSTWNMVYCGREIRVAKNAPSMMNFTLFFCTWWKNQTILNITHDTGIGVYSRKIIFDYALNILTGVWHFRFVCTKHVVNLNENCPTW